MKRLTIIFFVLFALLATPASAGVHRVYTVTGAAAISGSCAIYSTIRVKQVVIHFSAAATTSEDLDITLDSNAGAAYDTVLYTIDPSVASNVDIVWIPNHGSLVLLPGDTLDITYANTDTGTIAVSVYYELEP